MIPLFNGPTGIRYSIRHSEYFANLKDMLEIDIFRLTNYFRSSSRSVNNNDIIVKLIKSFNIDVRLNKFDFLNIVESKDAYIERSAGIISNASFGRVLEVLNSDAIILSVSHNVEPLFIDKIWEDQTPLRPISSSSTDISLPHPDKMTPEFTGFTLDTKLLLAMWYNYSRNTTKPRLEYFVYRYVYANMIPYYLDLAIINIFLGKDIKKFKNTNPIQIINQTSKIIRYTDALIRKTKGKKLFYEEIMLNLKLVKNNNMLDFYTIGQTFITTQSRHGLFILYKDIILALIFYLGGKGIRKNLGIMKDVFLLTQRMQVRKDIRSIDYGMYTEDIESSLDLLVLISKNRRI